MKYVTLGATGLKASRFGLGCVRFIDDGEQSAINLIRYALDNGVNYLDTAYYYGNSEEIVGKALTNGYRDKAILVTKSPLASCEKYEDLEKYLDIELKKLQTDYIDIYLIHNIDAKKYHKVAKLNYKKFFESMKKKGKIRYHGCSVHGSFEHLKQVIDNHSFQLMTLQVGLLDTDIQAGVKGLKYVSQNYNMPTSIMSPLRGGNLVKYAPQKVHDLINSFPVKRSIAEWGFRYLYNMPEVSVVLSGVSNIEQLKDNIKIFSKAETNVINIKEQQLLQNIKTAFLKSYAVPCTTCKYCLPCPQNINIPKILSLYNKISVAPNHIDNQYYQNEMIANKTDVSQCIECGACEKQCPQEIKIIKKLKEAHEKLSEKRDATGLLSI